MAEDTSRRFERAHRQAPRDHPGHRPDRLRQDDHAVRGPPDDRQPDEIKILTVEDPIEYHLDGINQIQVQPQDRPDASPAACGRSCVTTRT